MMKGRLYYPAILCLCVLILGCTKELMISNPKRPAIIPNHLELHGDRIEFEVKADIIAGSLAPQAVYRLTPHFIYGNKELKLQPLEFDKSKGPGQRIGKYILEFRDGMEEASLEVHGTFSDTKTGEQAAYRLPLATTRGIITTSRLAEPLYKTAYSPQGPFYAEIDTLILDFEFALGSYELELDHANNELTQKLNELIASDNIILGSKVIGTHSPVGSDEINRVLSEKRALEVKKMYDDRIKGHTNTEYDKVGLDLEVEFNSWAIFIEKLRNTAFWDRNKDIIVEITSTSNDYETMKSKLLELHDINRISREVFPKLQMSRLEIAYARMIRDDDELSNTVNSILEGSFTREISGEEILSIAQRDPNLSRRILLYHHALSEEKSAELLNDWAATYLDMQSDSPRDTARKYVLDAYGMLLASVKLGQSEEACINLGIINTIAGRYSLALDYFDRAKALNQGSGSPPIDSYLQSRGMAELGSGHYKLAAASLAGSSATSTELAYNLGLAQLLAGDHSAAINTLSGLKGQMDPSKTFYTMAIAANRAGQTRQAMQFLSQAFDINPRYNDFFHRDYEFKNLNKAVLTGYPDSLKRAVSNFKRSGRGQIPILAYPLPKSSYTKEISIENPGTMFNYGQLADQLTSIMMENGWEQKDLSWFELPQGGFSLLAKVEQTDEFGQSLLSSSGQNPEIRFNLASEPDDFLTNYTNSLAYAEPGYYRLFVIVVSKQPSLNPGKGNEDFILLETSAFHLADSTRNTSLGDHTISFQAYEFERSLTREVNVIYDSGVDHYVTSGIDTGLKVK